MDDNYFAPGLYMEMDEYGEYVRLYHIDPVDGYTNWKEMELWTDTEQ